MSLVTVPLYLRAVGLERYGVLALCWTLLATWAFLNLGLGPSVAQKIASLRHADPDARADVFWTALWVSCVIGMAAGLLVYCAAGLYFAAVHGLPVGIAAEIAGAKTWLAVIVPVVMIGSVLSGALQGEERFLEINVINSGATTLMSLTPLAVAYAHGPHLSGLLAASLGARIAALAAQFFACRRALPVRQVRWIRPKLLRQLLIFGSWISASTAIAPLLLTVDRLVIGATLGAAAVSIYTVPYNLVSRIQIVPAALATVLFPRFAATAQNGEEGNRLEIECIAVLSTIMTPLTVFALAVLGPFLSLWIGQDLAVRSAPVAYLILFGFWANSVARIPYSRMLGSGRPDLITKITLAEVLPYIAMLFVGIWQFGVVGAAAAWSLRTLVDTAVFLAFTNKPSAAFKALAVPLLLTSTTLVAAAMPLGQRPASRY